MSIEILCRRNAKGVDMESAVRSTKITLDAAHISAGCHGIDDIAQCLLDSYVSGDARALERLKRKPYAMVNNRLKSTGGLFNEVYRLVLDVSDQMNWNIKEKGEDKVRILTKLAIETVSKKPVCKKCDGTKFVECKPCPACSATGIRRDNGYLMAKKLGVNQSTWSRTWQYRFQDVVCMLETIRSRAGSRVINQIFTE